MTRGLDTEPVTSDLEYIIRLESNLFGASQFERFMDMPISTTCHVEDYHVDFAANYN
jgi:hypothetical protein